MQPNEETQQFEKSYFNMASHLSSHNLFVLVIGGLFINLPISLKNIRSDSPCCAYSSVFYSSLLQSIIFKMVKPIKTMKKSISALSILCLIANGIIHSSAITTTKQPQKQMETIKNSKTVVQNFFNAFGKGDYNGIINSFHEQCNIIAVREGNRKDAQIYGTYTGKEGAKAFIANLGNTFDTKAFTVEHIISEGQIVFANGKFTHVVKQTGQSYSSQWALMCVIKDHKIIAYHFYEDSQKFSEASK